MAYVYNRYLVHYILDSYNVVEVADEIYQEDVANVFFIVVLEPVV